jgi:hypothetical protein
MSLFAFDVDSVITSIATPKNVISQSDITTLKDPFERPISKEGNETNKTTVVAKPSFQLNAIFDGTALIDGKWRRIGDNVHGYRLTQINSTSVIIASKENKKTLYLFKGVK